MFIFFFFFFNDTATTEIYTLSLHDALPISRAMLSWLSMLLLSHPQAPCVSCSRPPIIRQVYRSTQVSGVVDRKSTRLNSSHANISYAVFCLKKKKHYNTTIDIVNNSQNHTA